MAAMSRGPDVRSRIPKRPKGGMPSSRRHRFESFSQRIAKLKIEPVRRGRNTLLDDAELETTYSYFKTSLDEWRDLNLSEIFTAFTRQVTPLAESLPQIIHHHDRILDLLVEYIEKGDKWSAEALLSLMAHFAHDLGVRFETHFERAVKAVSQLAARHQDVEVIEWSFSCLAWLFKYLSRLLVPDLRSLFDLMAPLLGQQHQKYFVTRFAAESLSFLVRKAGAAYHRDKTPLRLILRHVSDQLKELQGTGNDHEFRQGLLSLFADSIKGVQRGLHSSATAILQEMLLQTYNEEHIMLRTPPFEPILSGVIISVIHHSDAENFKPLLETILQQIDSKSSEHFTGLSSRLLFIVAGVRKGTRVTDWKSILESLHLLVNSISNADDPNVSDKENCLSAAAVVFQYCPLDIAIPHVQIFETLSKGHWEPAFLPFCNLYADLGTERFKTLVLPYFKRFVAHKANDYSNELSLVLPNLHRNGAFSNGSVQPSKTWYEDMSLQIEAMADPDVSNEDMEPLLYRCNAFLETAKILEIPADIKKKVSSQLLGLLEQALVNSKSSRIRPVNLWAAGNGLQFLVQEASLHDKLLAQWKSLCQASTVYGHSLIFWQSLLHLAERNQSALDLAGPHKEPLNRALMQCIGSPSHDMRLAGLGLIEIIVGKGELQDTVATALMVEQTPLNLENVRHVSMRIRQLAKSFPTVCSHDWAEAIPTFCFGLLHVKFSQVWDDACAALKDMCETKEGEARISQLAVEWLHGATDQATLASPVSENAPTGRLYATEFECTNLMQLEKAMSRNKLSSEETKQQLKSMFEAQHAQLPFITPFSRTQALRLLDTVPQVAEKRSRSLVPVLLHWVLDEPSADTVEDDEIEPAMSNEADNRWTRRDQKALLSVFSKFTNPTVLFRSTEVYEALLVLLGNGDAEIQKAALKTILTWKHAAINRYQENLFNLLDDARFREEVAVFMDVGEEDNLLQQEHRDQLLPVILRLLYGKVISGRRGQEAKRKAVFIALTRFENSAILQFLGIAFGPLNGVSILEGEHLNKEILEKGLLSPRKQLGMLNMLEDMLNTLKTTLRPFTSSIVDPLLYCLIMASRGLLGTATASDSEKETDHNAQLSLLRTIRQRGFHSLNILFESCPDFAWSKYIPTIVEELVNPRLQQFPIETAQSISGLLRLFAAWSKSPLTAPYLVEQNPDIMPKILDCLEIPSAKDEVKIYILDNIVRVLIGLAASTKDAVSTTERMRSNRIHSDILQPYANAILTAVGDLLRKSPSRDLLESSVYTIAELAPHVAGSAEARSLTEVATFLLRQPSKRVNAQTKTQLLSILHQFVPRCDNKDLTELFDSIFDASCSLFSYAQDKTARALLCNIVEDLSVCNEELQPVAKLCHDLNSFSSTRLDEPDFERRSSAFTAINKNQESLFTLVQWKPLVYNMLYYIKDNDELSIRVNASVSLRRFIDASVQDEGFKGFLSSAVLPGIQNGMREVSELVRAEFLAVLSHLVESYPDWAPVADLRVLLGPDEESAFFGNVLHIQGHRRLRALRRLATNAPELQAGNTYHILIPLLEHFIFNNATGDENAHNMAGEAIRTVTALTKSLEWPQYRSLIKRFIGHLSKEETTQKTIIRLLAGLMDSLSQAGHAKGYVTGGSSSSTRKLSEDMNGEDAMEVDKPTYTLAKTLPQQEKLTKDVTSNILPPLTEFLHKSEESTVSLRVPIATAITKVLLVLPPQEVETRLPSILLDVCHILKSRSQESRDMSRGTLAEIATLTGPTYLKFILKSLRTALQRGYQLHVLSFTVHHILVKLSPDLAPGDLDYCLTDIVDIIMDDIFGVTGQEKDAEEYISKMKEVKSSKSYDSMDIIAQSATPSHLIDLILPIRSLLMERLNVKIVQKINELLRRIGLGVLQNPTVNDRDILIFCYELIQEVYNAKASPENSKQEDLKNKRYLLNMKGAAKSGARGSSSSYMYVVTRFSLDVLRTILRKHEELQTPQNLAGFLPIIGDALVQGQEEIKVSAMRLLTTVIKVPLPALDKDCSVYVTEAVQVIKAAPSTNTELAQASLKLIAAVLRERPSVNIKERDLAQLLKRLLPDLDEPDRQGVIFGFIKTVLTRKIVIAEVYEVMDRIAVIMIVNGTKSARDLARNSYFYFLQEYPQARNRFNKQLEFLIRNLRYDHVEGRQSVMEALNLILTKTGDAVLQDVLGMMFIPLIHSMANDESADCRTMSGALIKKLFERADPSRLKSFTDEMRGWLDQNEDTGLKRLGIQCWGLYFEATESKPTELAFVLEQLQTTVEECLGRRDEDDWELIYYSLTVYSKLCKTSPDTSFSSSKQDFWVAIYACVSYPHAWVKLTAAKLIGIFFADLASTNGDSGLDTLPLEGSKGLQLTKENMMQLTHSFVKNLSIPEVTEDLCAQSVRNLAFLARCLAANGATWSWVKLDNDEEIDDNIIEEAQNGFEVNGNANASEGEEWGGFSPPPTPAKSTTTTTAIHRLISSLSGIIRRETKIMKVSSLYPKSAVMTLLETLTARLAIESLSSSLPHLLTTLSTLTDPATTIPRSTDPTFNDTYKSLIDKAREIMTTLQKRLGAQEYLTVMGDVQKGVKQRREDRRSKRKVEAVTMPEKYSKEKRRRHEVARQRKKEKGREERGRRRGW